MTTGFDGSTIFAGTANGFSRQFTFTRQADDATDWTGSAIFVRFYHKRGDISPLLTLSVGSGITVTTDAADSQVLTMDLTTSNLTTLRNSRNTNEIYYNWTIQPSGGQPTNAPKGGGYDGTITVVLESYAGD